MKKILQYYFIAVSGLLLIAFICVFFYNIILIPLTFIIFSFFKFLRFFFKYFIPIYFLLVLLLLDKSLLKVYCKNIINYFKNFIYNNKYIFFILVSILLMLGNHFEKINFIVIIFFILFYFILFYMYMYNNKLKIYIEKYLFYYSVSLVASIIYVINLSANNFEDLNYSSFFIDTASPRLFFKNSYSHLYKKYINQVTVLNKGILFYNRYLKDEYLSNFKHIKFNLDYNIITKLMGKSIALNKRCLNYIDLEVINYFKSIYAVDKLALKSNKVSKFYGSNFYDNLLFDLNFNKSLNNIKLDEKYLKTNIRFKDKNLYANSFIKELLISKNMLIQSNLSIKNYHKGMTPGNFFNINNKIFKRSNDEANLYLKDPFYNIFSFYYNNLFLNYIKNKYSDYFLNLKIKFIGFTYNSEKKFKNQSFTHYITLSEVKNIYSVCLDNSIIGVDAIENKEVSFNKNFRELNLESFFMLLNKYYKHFNIDINIINWLNEMFVNIFDVEKKKFNYLIETEETSDIEAKDYVNLSRHLMSNLFYIYKKKSNILLYNEYKRTGMHFESLLGVVIDAKHELSNYVDIAHLYSRFFNYDKHMEKFMNSYIYLSYDGSNIKKDALNMLFEYNKYFCKYNEYLNVFLLKVDNFDRLGFKGLFNYLNNCINKINLELDYNYDRGKIFKKFYYIKIKKILNLDYFIKHLVFKDYLLLNNFLDKDCELEFYLSNKKVEFYFFKKFNKLNDKNFNTFNNFKVIKNYKFELLDYLKSHIFRCYYYDFILKNKNLFSSKLKKEFNHLILFNELNKDIIEGRISIIKSLNEQFLLNSMLLNNLNYNKDFLASLFEVYTVTEDDLSFIFKSIYDQAEFSQSHLTESLEHVLTIKRYLGYNNELELISNMRIFENKFNILKFILINYNDLFTKIAMVDKDFFEGVNETNKKFKEREATSVYYFNYNNLLDYIAKKKMDMDYFKNLNKSIEEVCALNMSIKNKIIALNKEYNEKYIYPDYIDACNKMARQANELNGIIYNSYRKNLYKKTTFDLSCYLKVWVSKYYDKHYLNEGNVEDYKVYIQDCLDRMHKIQSWIDTDIARDLKRFQLACKKK